MLAAAMACVGLSLAAFAEEPKLSLAGDWLIHAEAVAPSGAVLKRDFQIQPVAAVEVRKELCGKIPDFNPKAWGGWEKGYALKGLKGQETTVKDALDPASLKIRSADSKAVYVKGKDYNAEIEWGSVGRIPGGAIAERQAVLIDYSFHPQRIDSIVISADGRELALKQGAPHICQPLPPAFAPGEIAVGCIYFAPGRIDRLTDANLFPILERGFPESLAASAKGSAEKLLPKTMNKLRSGGKLKILAWGDSVTDASYLQDKERSRWQSQFVARLKAKYPSADIELSTEAWGGHDTASYLAEPPGSVHNYKEKVLAAKPDLVIMEFINDAWLDQKTVDERYGRFLSDFKEIGAELIINTPHYSRPDWMQDGSKLQKGIDDDPRPYVKALRVFAAKNGVALSDVSMRYGRLWRQGIPYLTLLCNNINHPDAQGLSIFADSLMNLFP